MNRLSAPTNLRPMVPRTRDQCFGGDSRGEKSIPSKSRPAAISKASARIKIVGKRGARFARSIFEIAVVCSSVRRDSSSWDQPRSARSSLRLTANCFSGLTAHELRWARS